MLGPSPAADPSWERQVEATPVEATPMEATPSQLSRLKSLARLAAPQVSDSADPPAAVDAAATDSFEDNNLQDKDIEDSDNKDDNNKDVSDDKKESDPVPGFQLVQATGLSDTCTPPPTGSALPSFATPSPLAAPFNTQSLPRNSLPAPQPPPQVPNHFNPLVDNPKSKQFNQRFDYMVAEFFTRQVARLSAGTPETLDRNYRIFQQRFKERLGTQWAHVTSQPEVDEAIKQVQDMHDFFLRLEKMVDRHQLALEKLNDIDIEMSLFYQHQGYQESSEAISTSMLQLSQNYRVVAQERDPVIQSYSQYKEFLETFRQKAIMDALDTMKKQQVARLELDGYGSKLGQLEEKKLKTFARSSVAFGGSDGAPSEKELEMTRQRFQDAKSRYQSLSMQMIDKAGLLQLKRQVDFSAHLGKVMAAHEWFCRGFRMTDVSVPDEDQPVDVSKLKGFGSQGVAH